MKTIFLHTNTDFKHSHPFVNAKRNEVWPDLLQAGKDLGMNVVVSNFDSYDAARKRVSKAWIYDKGWKVEKNVKVNLMYYFGLNKTAEVIGKLAIKKNLHMINYPDMEVLCDDKIATALRFPDISPQTFMVNDHMELLKALRFIKSHRVVLKPRFGSFGRDIIFGKKTAIHGAITKDTIVQEFIDSSAGCQKLGITGYHDLRVMIINGKIDHVYVRIAPKGSYTANMTRGATKIYIDKDNLPVSVLKLVQRIDDDVKQYGTRIYSADFFFDQNHRPWLVELNSKPGTLYYGDKPKIRNKYYRNIFKALQKEI